MVKQMLFRGKQPKKEIQQWFVDCRNFFNNTIEIHNERNWEFLSPMSLLYLAFLCFYLFVMCPIMGIALQTAALRIFTLIHAIFTLCVFSAHRKAPAVWIVDASITLFALEILSLSAFLEIGVFTKEVSFLFPLSLVLMAQIYTRRPIYRFLEIVLPAFLYLLYCWATKDAGRFILDLISVSIAVSIACVAIITTLGYKLKAYQTQLALEKMCALDSMTGVNNKATFVFRVERFLRHPVNSHYALAICDLDHFKSVNDRYGHLIGDKVLRKFAGQLHQLVDNDPSIIAGRFGGDEFILFFKEYGDPQEIQKKLQILCDVSGFDFPVTCSIGLAFSSLENENFQQLFDCADKNLYQAKSKNQGSISAAGIEEAP